MKIAFLSSTGKCGIAVHTQLLQEKLDALGHDCRIWDSRSIYQTILPEILDWHPNVLHIQHEAAIVQRDLNVLAARIRSTGTKIVVTFHSDTKQAVHNVSSFTDQIILHRTSENILSYNLIPIGVPEYTLQRRSELRRHYGYGTDDIVLTTFGFMFDWKGYPEVLDQLVPWILESPRHHVQLLTSYHDTQPFHGARIVQAVSEIVQKYGINTQVAHVIDFVPTQEIEERLQLADLGYLYAPFDTVSASAAIRNFVSARLPVVASDSTHYRNDGISVVIAPRTIHEFVKVILRTIRQPDVLGELRARQEETYHRLKWGVIACRHEEIYQNLTVATGS